MEYLIVHFPFVICHLSFVIAGGDFDSTPVVWTLLKTRGAPLVGKNKSVLTSDSTPNKHWKISGQ
jgi:hypothetical protein